MKETSLIVFYRLGEGLADIHKLKIDMEIGEAMMCAIRPQQWLIAFTAYTHDVPMPESAKAAYALNRAVSVLLKPPFDQSRRVQQHEVTEILNQFVRFEKEFEREQRNISVFTVLPKGIYDTAALIERPENKFPEQIRSVFTEQILYDIQQAGRCLAFDCPTACAFHVLRATEALIRIYYEALARRPWPFDQRDWGSYVRELGKLPKVNRDVISRLDEIRKIDRNPNIHPDVNVNSDQSPMIFDLCSGVVYRMAEEIIDLAQQRVGEDG